MMGEIDKVNSVLRWRNYAEGLRQEATKAPNRRLRRYLRRAAVECEQVAAEVESGQLPETEA
jgi:hypothetical protein